MNVTPDEAIQFVASFAETVAKTCALKEKVLREMWGDARYTSMLAHSVEQECEEFQTIAAAGTAQREAARQASGGRGRAGSASNASAAGDTEGIPVAVQAYAEAQARRAVGGIVGEAAIRRLQVDRALDSAVELVPVSGPLKVVLKFAAKRVAARVTNRVEAKLREKLNKRRSR